MKGIIFDIQRSSCVDGPGIRTTVFFKGCNLKCAWCHNPESQSPQQQMLFYKSKCVGCGRCAAVAANDNNFICFNDARQLCGKEYTSDEVLHKVLRDRAFYEGSGGGVTFSGGECMLQIDFLCEVLKKCREHGIHTAVDTAGCVPWNYFERVLPHTDLFLYDVKLFDSDKHRQYTGADNKLILNNLAALLESGADVCVRVPIIGGVNDSIEEMNKIKGFIKPYRSVKVELLPYHAMGDNKYRAVGREPQVFSTPCNERMKELNAVFD